MKFRLLPLFAALVCMPLPATVAALHSALEVVTVETSERQVVHRAEGKLESPHFSPDGAMLYFNTGGRILRLDLAAPGPPPALVDTGFATQCINDHDISPDGTLLVLCDRSETGQSLMYLMPIAGGTPRRVDVAAPAYWHGWSPDGATLTYCAERGGNYDVYTVPIAGGPETRLTDDPGNDNGCDYSADGKWIYFHTERTGSIQVWRMRTDGSDQHAVTSDSFDNWFPHPSPDGKWIAILSTKVPRETGHPPDGDYVLRLLPVDGGAPREIAHFSGANGSLNVPSWSPDSTRIAFASYTHSP